MNHIDLAKAQKHGCSVIRDGDSMLSGEKLELNHKIFFNPDPDTTEFPDLLQKSAEELQAMFSDSMEKERQLYDKISSLAEKWDEQAALTKTLLSALEYVKMPTVKHTSNIWVKTGRNEYEISNMVYFMRYSISEQTHYDTIVRAYRPSAWFVSWSFGYNRPHPYGRANKYKLQEQKQKRFKSEAAADSYIQKEIEAHANKFMELSPPIPEADEVFFYVKQHLAPGYTVAPHEPTMEELLACLDIGGDSPAETQPTEATPAKKEKRAAPKKPGKRR